MASTPFFGKREPVAVPMRPNPPQNLSGGTPTTGAAGTAVMDVVVPATAVTESRPGPAAHSAPEGGSKLTVGPNIKLKGVEITECDTLVVDGLVEATMDSRLMQISEIGAFKGSAQIDIAEIRGSFDGDLTVRDRLVIYATGRVTGKIRYGKVVIEEGGQLSGDITFGTTDKARTASNKPALQMAA